MVPLSLSEEEYYYKLDNMVLSSTQYLRKVLKNRYKTETDKEWIDDPEHIQQFLGGPGKNAYKNAQRAQKTVLDNSQTIEDWDMTLLSALIQNFGDEKKYLDENAAVKKLKTMRNDLAHHTTKKIAKPEYTSSVATFRTSLLAVGMENEEINKIIDKAGVTSSVKAYEFVKDLYTKAEQQEQKGKLKEAEDLFSEATQVPSLLPWNLGRTYERRAEHFLSRIEDPIRDTKFCENALLDVTKALELNDCSWIAHYLAAKCYRWKKNELPQAITHYKQSLAISPAQSDVKIDLDTCKVLAGVHSRHDHMNPALMSMNLEEWMKRLENETEIKISGSQFVKFNGNQAGAVIKGLDHVFRGHKHFQGFEEVPQNVTEAVKYYSKAASVKNPEGMYNLAKCYHYGYGVEQSFQEAHRMYMEVAEMDPNMLGEWTPRQKNVGVAYAQYALGLMYDLGMGVEQDYAQAAKWYQRGMENGAGNAANNLGILYDQGRVIPPDPKMAEFCWKQAVNLKDVNAPASLIAYYINASEPEMATEMLEIGRKMKNDILLAMPDDDFQRIMTYIQQYRLSMESKVLEFEQQHNLDTKGLTFQQRVTRCTCHDNENITKMTKTMEDLRLSETPSSWDGKLQGLTGETISALKKRAVEGSVTAQRVLSTVDYCFQLNNLLLAREEFDDNQKMEVVNILYKIATLEFHHLFFNGKGAMQKLKSIVGSLFEEKYDQKGEDDMKIRLCFVSFNLSGTMDSEDNYGLELLQEGLRRYPENVHYFKTLSDFLGCKKKFKLAAQNAERGLKVFPDDPNLLYSYAVQFEESHTTNHKDLVKIIGNYKDFISKAPCDHRKLPEAYYRMSRLFCGLEKDFEMGSFSNVLAFSQMEPEQADAYFRKGEEAEKYQLPCYLPYCTTGVKESVSALLDTWRSEKNSNKKTEPNSSNNNLTSSPAAEGTGKSILNKKEYLGNPVRKTAVLKHRQGLKMKDKGKVESHKTPKLQQMIAQKMADVKPITFQEMESGTDCIYENRVIDLTIIEDPNPHPSPIHLLAEDENGDVIRVFVYNVNKTEATLKNFQAGCRVAIVNPYMRVGTMDSACGIHNYEPRCLLYMEKVVDMCRFCGEENAPKKCSKCKRPYCSLECQQLDWKEFEHKLLHSKKL